MAANSNFGSPENGYMLGTIFKSALMIVTMGALTWLNTAIWSG